MAFAKSKATAEKARADFIAALRACDFFVLDPKKDRPNSFALYETQQHQNSSMDIDRP